MWHNLSALFDKLSVDPNVRAIVYSGAGRAFTAGLDVQAASEGGTFAPPTVDSARKANGIRTSPNMYFHPTDTAQTFEDTSSNSKTALPRLRNARNRSSA